MSEEEDSTEVLDCELLPGIRNRMARNCGPPPKIDLSKPHGYFENDWGEQGLMQFDLGTGVCRVWMGDCGWPREIRCEELNGRLLIRYLTPAEGGEPVNEEHRETVLKGWPDF